jgi:hypothetical protein
VWGGIWRVRLGGNEGTYIERGGGIMRSMHFGALVLREWGSGRLRFVGFSKRVWGGRRFP